MVSKNEWLEHPGPHAFPHAVMHVVHAAKTASKRDPKKGDRDDTPLQVVGADVHDLFTLSAIVSSTHKPDTFLLTCGHKKDPNPSLRTCSLLIKVHSARLSRVSMLYLSAHMHKKDHKCVYMRKWQNSCEEVPSTASKQPFKK